VSFLGEKPSKLMKLRGEKKRHCGQRRAWNIPRRRANMKRTGHWGGKRHPTNPTSSCPAPTTRLTKGLRKKERVEKKKGESPGKTLPPGQGTGAGERKGSQTAQRVERTELAVAPNIIPGGNDEKVQKKKKRSTEKKKETNCNQC